MAYDNKILLIDDNDDSRHDLQAILSFLGEPAISSTSADWQKQVTDATDRPEQITLVLISHCSELQKIIEAIHDWEQGTPIILLNDQAVPESLDAEIASRIIATLPAPLSYQPLLDALHKAKVFHEHFNRLRDFDGVRDFTMFHSLVGNSPAIQQVRYMMGQVANTEVSVLITGESGTGKEVVARNLHQNSARADKPFVPINCGAIPRELLESELFGHEKGAFTGAIASRAGRFELADGGTLFLDEIGDMPLNMQVKLLRVLQERSFERVGGVKTITTDVRILAATHMDLEEMIERGEFRQDLYYRINVFPIRMPALRERAEDIPLLLNEIITELEAEGRGSVRFNSSAIESICEHPWPGNVRELANLVERMAILYPHGIIGVQHMPEKFHDGPEVKTARGDTVTQDAALQVPPPQFEPRDQALLPLKGLDLKTYLANLEKSLIGQALNDSDGVVARAAERLHIRRTTLVEKMRKYKLQKKSDEESE